MIDVSVLLFVSLSARSKLKESIYLFHDGDSDYHYGGVVKRIQVHGRSLSDDEIKALGSAQ